MTHSRHLMVAASLVASLSAVAKAQSIGDDIEHQLEALLQSVSPIADGQITENEYASSEFLSFVDLENPGNPYPPLNQMCGAVLCNDDDPVDGDEDLSATVSWGYTESSFFFGFDVTDQTIDADDGVAPFQNDGVELAIDADGDGEDERNWSLEGFKFNTDTINDGTVGGSGPFWVPEDPEDGEWTHAAGLTESGYIIEFEIPLGSLDMESSDPQTIDADEAVPATTGHTMRMNFAINDIDVEFAGQGEGTHAMWWVYEDNPASPFGGAEGNWVVGMTLGGPAGPPGAVQLQAGDADEDLDFDQLDLVRVQVAAKYLTGQSATWGEGDWNGAPGGLQGSPPEGDGVFNQLDIIAALAPGHYLTGPYGAIASGGEEGDDQTSIFYDPETGEVSVDAPAGVELTSINIDSAGGIFTGEAAQNLGGSFDNDADDNVFKATFGGSFGSLSFGNVAQTGLTQDFVLNDLTVVGSLAGGGDLGAVDLIYVPEPSATFLALLGALATVTLGRPRYRRLRRITQTALRPKSHSYTQQTLNT